MNRSTCLMCGMLLIGSAWSGPDDRIFASGFETEATVLFVGDKSVALDAAGQQHEFHVRVVDDQGLDVPGATVNWSLASTADIDLVATGPLSAQITVSQFNVGSTQLTATDGSGGSATASIAIAQTQPNTHLIPSDAVISGNTPLSGTTPIVLERRAATEVIQPGDVVVSGSLAGLLVRVVSVLLTATEVQLTAEPATLTDAFARLSVNAASPYSKGLRRSVGQAGFGKGVPIQALVCRDLDGQAVPVTVTNYLLLFVTRFQTSVTLEIDGGAVQSFSVDTSAEVTGSANSGKLDIGAALAGPVRCSAPLGEFEPAPVALSALTFATRVAPNVGVIFDGDFDAETFSIPGPLGDLQATVTSGLGLTSALEWEPNGSTTASGDIDPPPADFDLGVEFATRIGPSLQLDVDLVVTLGQQFEPETLVDDAFLRPGVAGVQALTLAGPLDPQRRDYPGPRWENSVELEGTLMVPDGAWSELLDILDIGVALPAPDSTLFEPRAEVVSRSPTINLVADCGAVCTVDPALPITVNLSMAAEAPDGSATFVAAADGQLTVMDLATSFFIDGDALASWITAGEPAGDYEFLPRLEVDELSQVYPYATLALDRLAMVRSISGSQSVWVVNDDGSDLRQLSSEFSLVRDVRWSPDGSRLYFRGGLPEGAARKGGGPILRTGLYSVLADGSQQQRLIDAAIGEVGTYDLSRDGRWIGATVGDLQIAQWDVYTLQADGGSPTRWSSSGTAGLPIFGPANNSLVFDNDFNLGTFTVANPQTGASNVIAGGFEAPAPWSPDGSRILVRRDETPNPGQTELFSIQPNGAGAINLSNIANMEHLDAQAQWSPDGTKIFFIRYGDMLDQVMMVNPDGTGLNSVSGALGDLWAFTGYWSADSRWLGMTLRNDATGIRTYLVRHADATVRTLPYGCCLFAPTGSAMAYYDTDLRDLILYDPDADSELNMTHTEGADGFVGFAPDGTRVAFSNGGSLHLVNIDGSGMTELVDFISPVVWRPRRN